MKYALIFAATAAAYDGYGGYGAVPPSSAPVQASSSAPGYGGYGAAPPSSAPVQAPSSAPAYGGVNSQPATPIVSTQLSKATPCSTSVGSNGYTTVVVGYGKEPVTVTSQYQAYPTCVAKGYDGKTCDKWGEDKYVSTTVTDCNKNVVTITKVQDYITVYQEKKTITHSATPTIGGYGAASTPASGNKNATGTWYELYEKIHVVEYQNMGKNALPGYSGSGLCQTCDQTQPVLVKEYKGGKWTEEKKEFTYGKPKEEVKVYEKPGVYTVPAKVVTVDYPVTYIDTATKTAKAGETCTYGGQYKEVKSTGTVTGSYGAIETKIVNGQAETVTVTKTVTVFCGKIGKCELSPATTTVYNKDTVITYPTGKVQEAGVYNYDSKVITITKPNQAYTCEYNVATATPASKTPTKGQEYPTTVASTQNDYGYKASITPSSSMPSNEYPSYPNQPVKSNTTSSVNGGYGETPKAKTTPCTTLTKASSTPLMSSVSKPSYGDHSYDNNKPSTSVPSKATSTPCTTLVKASSTPAASSVSKPSYGNTGYGNGNNKPSTTAPSQATSTPCETPAASKTPSKGEEYPPSVQTKTPSYDSGYGQQPKSTPTPAAPSQPSYNNGYGETPKSSPTPATPAQPYNNNNNNGYGEANQPSYNNGYGGQAQSSPSPSPVKPAYPAESGGYGTNTEYGKTNAGYSKRGGMIERRRAVSEAQQAKRVILL